mmetsp:Transcript_8537/g.20683  ORF Transcript_8537/g.20683 Transcript_8537/m.20683 type:complete len:134 (+) Transcript_8537:315-716(+)|eukprot:CAMPEP_0178985058 /NCGR_PEP_ID=MMETSP0795-20121207/1949_1 /TAXON_ID=88552 /ORGANISM="Amoebophrya sp., Strain Ameob2" /LENGTH=133 /DNA_ID=CAMNT_0020675989 /DNA_START=258 /DNA_END=659 /DNA_ORIENTATION=+
MGQACCAEERKPDAGLKGSKKSVKAAAAGGGRATTNAERGFEEGWYRASYQPGAAAEKDPVVLQYKKSIRNTTAEQRGFQEDWMDRGPSAYIVEDAVTGQQRARQSRAAGGTTVEQRGFDEGWYRQSAMQPRA